LAPVPVPSNFQYKTRRFLTKLPPAQPSVAFQSQVERENERDAAGTPASMNAPALMAAAAPAAAPAAATIIEENHFFLTLAEGFVGFTENDKLCFFFFLLFPLPATAPKKPNVPHHFVNHSSGLNNKWTGLPRAIPPPKID
jgi:hypothetical protein